MAPRPAGASITVKWTTRDRRAAQYLVRQGFGAERIAALLGVESSVVQRHFRAVPGRRKLPDRIGEHRVFSEHEVEMAQTLAAYGASDSQIASLLRVSAGVLAREAGEAMSAARVMMNLQMARCVWRQAVGGSTQAAIFWLRTRGGEQWKENHTLTVESKSGVLVAPAGLSPDAWIAQETERQDREAEQGAGVGAGGDGRAASTGERAVKRMLGSVIDMVVDEQTGEMVPGDARTEAAGGGSGGSVPPWSDDALREDVQPRGVAMGLAGGGISPRVATRLEQMLGDVYEPDDAAEFARGFVHGVTDEDAAAALDDLLGDDDDGVAGGAGDDPLEALL